MSEQQKEGEFKKQVKTLWQNIEIQNRAYDTIEVHALKRVLLGEVELIFEDAKKEYPMPREHVEVLGEGTYTTGWIERLNADRYEWFKKWFGSEEK